MRKLLLLSSLLLVSTTSFGMHIAEGFLPPFWSLGWWIAFIPFLVIGIKSLSKKVKEEPKHKILIAVVTAFTFVLSALKLPSLTGSCSHLTGIALGAILFGMGTMSVAGFIVLLFQALLLAHGGITTLGANAMSMAVVGAITAIFTYKMLTKLNAPQWAAVFAAAFISDISTYATTAFQLGLAFNNPNEGLLFSIGKFASVLAYTQLPLAIIEGLATVLIYNAITKYSFKEIQLMNEGISE